jgi:hypothetical protein
MEQSLCRVAAAADKKPLGYLVQQHTYNYDMEQSLCRVAAAEASRDARKKVKVA